jgi:hypothetical protein
LPYEFWWDLDGSWNPVATPGFGGVLIQSPASSLIVAHFVRNGFLSESLLIWELLFDWISCGHKVFKD